jgi:membrane fusion protein (multidrug efflux system)
VHPGQYLDAGTDLTTLQAVASAVHIDFAVPQTVASGLARGSAVQVLVGGDDTPFKADIVAVDARVDPQTRNATVRARLAGGRAGTPAPGASVQVMVPVGPPQPTVVIPATALRKGPEGDHVFVVEGEGERGLRAHVRRVEAGAMSGDEVLVRSGLHEGEQVATSGSFKLRDGMLVAIANRQASLAGK